MRKRTEPKLGDLELQILNILWARGPSTVRDVLEVLDAKPKLVYTSILTMMRIMHEKGYLNRKEQGKAHVYQARLREKKVKGGLLRNLIDSAFRGSPEALLLRLLEEEKLSKEELNRVRRLLIEKGQN